MNSRDLKDSSGTNTQHFLKHEKGCWQQRSQLLGGEISFLFVNIDAKFKKVYVGVLFESKLLTQVNCKCDLWSRYSYESVSSIPQKSLYFNEQYLNVKKVLVDTFFGPPERGVYSASVQSTLLQMAKAVLGRFGDISSVKLKMPNIHFLPVNISSKDHGSIVKFNDDVYLPTDEPHGSIEASLSRFWSKM
ncbi:hypothetical protein Gorai_003990 [Gossypium raimondii]|uniref:factor independent urate hydroxylase n=1 Tax=Gossypium raimondii TaxID=29730 RepID=A0A7J8QGV4_GOSRA|nr:hypothetical protein [Gossypium raimondii]